MKKNLLFFAISVFLFQITSFAHGDFSGFRDPAEKTFIKNIKRKPDTGYQQELRNAAPWQSFLQNHGNWFVIFNEENSKPHRAFGTPIPVAAPGNAKDKAISFISSRLADFRVPESELVFQNASATSSYQYVHFYQKHKGLKVLFSSAYVKMTLDNKVVLFGLDVYDRLDMNINPTLGKSDAEAIASSSLPYNVTSVRTEENLAILPIPTYRRNDYRLVYELYVETTTADNIPGNYYTLVDAGNGEILYRQNLVKFINPCTGTAAPMSMDVTLGGTLYPTHPYNPSSDLLLPNCKINVTGTNYYTNGAGYVNLPYLSPESATITLEGLWSKVVSGNSGSASPFFTATVNPGTNNISFSGTTIRHLSAYYHVNIIHDYMKSFFSTFTSMDNPLTTRVDRTDGNCNAFYNGNSINFYTTSNGCNSLAMVSDVIYHEYGHGISDKFYTSRGSSFGNGAMGEGYSDIWAMALTQSPVLGIGYSTTDPSTYVRRYDVNRKVYPQHLIGEVHADGEIICGAWWDAGVNLGSIPHMMQLFTETYNALVTGPNGSEGIVFTDILVEALQADDVPANGGDNNITNGTPNATAIANGFAQHGITLLSNADLNHTDIKSHLPSATIQVNSSLSNVMYPWALSGVKGYYKEYSASTWIPIAMTNTSGNNWSGSIPSQPLGTIISYYLGLEDMNGILTNVTPRGANEADPNVPFYILVGFALDHTEDFDGFLGPWIEGNLPGDDATTGKWEITSPIPSYIDPLNPNSIVQVSTNVTPGGQFCAVTANAPLATSAAGTSDVDAGKTTLLSPKFNMSSYTNPAVTYFRAFSNNQGANPGNDPWVVQISNDDVTWIDVERTYVADKTWRRVAFRVLDYVTLTSNVSFRFIASDSTLAGLPNNGQSLVEAALDDFQIYDEGISAIAENSSAFNVAVYPNPVSNSFVIELNSSSADNISVSLYNNLGQHVTPELKAGISTGLNRIRINLSSFKLQNGIYHLEVTGSNGKQMKKISVLN